MPVGINRDYRKRHIQERYEDVNAFGLKSSNSNVATNSHLELHQYISLLMSRAHPCAPVGLFVEFVRKPVHLEAIAADVGFMYSSADKDLVIVTAWGSGQLQIDALTDEIQPQWNIWVPTHLNVELHGKKKSVAMICDSDLQDPVALRSHRPSKYRVKCEEQNRSCLELWMGHSPPLPYMQL